MELPDAVPIPLPEAARRIYPHIHAFQCGPYRCLVSRDAGRWHLSVSHAHRLPTWEELDAARRKFLSDDLWMVQVSPPSKHYVNLHPNVLHLWELRDEELKEICSEPAIKEPTP